MDVIKEIRKAYIQLCNEIDIVVYDRFVPDDVSDETYVVVTAQEDSEELDKCDNGHTVVGSFEIFHKTLNNSGGVKCDDVADVLIPKIRNSALPLPIGLTFIQGSTRKISDTTLDGLSDTYKVYRRIIRFQHIIKEN